MGASGEGAKPGNNLAGSITLVPSGNEECKRELLAQRANPAEIRELGRAARDGDFAVITTGPPLPIIESAFWAHLPPLEKGEETTLTATGLLTVLFEGIKNVSDVTYDPPDYRLLTGFPLNGSRPPHGRYDSSNRRPISHDSLIGSKYPLDSYARVFETLGVLESSKDFNEHLSTLFESVVEEIKTEFMAGGFAVWQVLESSEARVVPKGSPEALKLILNEYSRLTSLYSGASPDVNVELDARFNREDDKRRKAATDENGVLLLARLEPDATGIEDVLSWTEEAAKLFAESRMTWDDFVAIWQLQCVSPILWPPVSDGQWGTDPDGNLIVPTERSPDDVAQMAHGSLRESMVPDRIEKRLKAEIEKALSDKSTEFASKPITPELIDEILRDSPMTGKRDGDGHPIKLTPTQAQQYLNDSRWLSPQEAREKLFKEIMKDWAAKTKW